MLLGTHQGSVARACILIQVLGGLCVVAQLQHALTMKVFCQVLSKVVLGGLLSPLACPCLYSSL